MNIPKDITIDQIDDIIDKLNNKRLEIKFDIFRVKTLDKITIDKYNELKIRIRKLYQYSEIFDIPKKYEVNCDLYENNGNLYFSVDTYGGNSESEKVFINNSDIINNIKKDLNKEFEDIKLELYNYGVDHVVFITKIIEEIISDDNAIIDIIE